MNRRISILLAFFVFMSLNCTPQLNIGNAEIPVPNGWKKSFDGNERINLLSPDRRQQATISVIRFESNTFEDFKRVCEHRLNAEKTEAPDISINADEPFVDSGRYGMLFSGNEKATGRSFSGYLTQKDAQLITVYLESIDVDSTVHFQTFDALVKGIKWR